MAADFHTAFNVLLAILLLFILDPLSAVLIRMLPDRQQSADPSPPLLLDGSIMGTPPVALAGAARETLHMGDLVEGMLNQAIVALRTNDRKLVAQISRTDNAVDRLYEAIKLCVTKATNRLKVSDAAAQIEADPPTSGQLSADSRPPCERSQPVLPDVSGRG